MAPPDPGRDPKCAVYMPVEKVTHTYYVTMRDNDMVQFRKTTNKPIAAVPSMLSNCEWLPRADQKVLQNSQSC